MKKILFASFAACLSFGVLFSIPKAIASHSITTCTNSCVIGNDGNGNITIQDCCGGTVTTVYPRHTAAEAPKET